MGGVKYRCETCRSWEPDAERTFGFCRAYRQQRTPEEFGITVYDDCDRVTGPEEGCELWEEPK